MNGRPLRGLLDTGAAGIVLTLAGASSVGIDPARVRAAKPVVSSGANGLQSNGWLHQVQSFGIGAERFANLGVVIKDFTLPDADVLIGEPYIEGRKIWLSYAAKQIFVQAPAAR